jgi:arsenate reductase (glutaredoxin)
MLPSPWFPDHGTCHSARNDDKRSSFRVRDNVPVYDVEAALECLAWKRGGTLKRCGEMKATIYHNPLCGTSRKTLEILRDSGADVWIHEYLKNPPTREELKRLYERAGITPRQGLRAKEPLAEELGLNRPNITDEGILDAMAEHPILIERPLVETSKGVRLCRPQDKVREIL